MSKIIKSNVSTGNVNLNGVGSTTLATLNTSNVLGHNLDNCLIYIDAVIMAVSNTARVAIYKGHLVAKKVAGTITTLGALSGVDQTLEEAPNMTGAVTFAFSASGNNLILTVFNTSALNLTIEGVMNLVVGAYGSNNYVDYLNTFP